MIPDPFSSLTGAARRWLTPDADGDEPHDAPSERAVRTARRAAPASEPRRPLTATIAERCRRALTLPNGHGLSNARAAR